MQITSKYPFTQMGGPAAETTHAAARDSVKATVDTFLHACGQEVDHHLYGHSSGQNFFVVGSTERTGADVSDVVAHLTGHAILDSIGPNQFGGSRPHPSHARYEDVLTRAMSAKDPAEHSALMREARALLVAEGFNVTK